MKKSSGILQISLVLGSLTIVLNTTGCNKKGENETLIKEGTFKDTIINLSDLNTAYDDYNLVNSQLVGNSQIVFSSNRGSAGGQFDLVQGNISFSFNQNNGELIITSGMTSDPFLSKLLSKANSSGNDFGPYRLFSSTDGYEYLLLASQNGDNLDLCYLKNRPVFGNLLPDVSNPSPVKILNSGFDDAYICFDSNNDTVYFSSDREGDFEIYLHHRPLTMVLDEWFSLDYAPSTKVDSINSTAEDKCPFVYRNIMVFTSNRTGGLGGFDLYYSLFKNGKWGSPVNLGPRINTSSDEYRPIIGYNPNFKNLFMIFSSDRSGGKGGFDLYFTGIEFPE